MGYAKKLSNSSFGRIWNKEYPHVLFRQFSYTRNGTGFGGMRCYGKVTGAHFSYLFPCRDESIIVKPLFILMGSCWVPNWSFNLSSHLMGGRPSVETFVKKLYKSLWWESEGSTYHLVEWAIEELGKEHSSTPISPTPSTTIVCLLSYGFMLYAH